MMMVNSLSDRLREERKRLGMSQAEIAQKVSIKRETWSRYETAKIVPGASVLLRAVTLGVDITYVLTGKRPIATNNVIEFRSSALSSNEDSKAYKVDLTLTQKERELLRHYREANKEGKKTIDDIAKLLAVQ